MLTSAATIWLRHRRLDRFIDRRSGVRSALKPSAAPSLAPRLDHRREAGGKISHRRPLRSHRTRPRHDLGSELAGLCHEIVRRLEIARVSGLSNCTNAIFHLILTVLADNSARHRRIGPSCVVAGRRDLSANYADGQTARAGCPTRASGYLSLLLTNTAVAVRRDRSLAATGAEVCHKQK
jgi:hypothetical protein